MSRTIMDRELRRWEVFASTGAQGFPAPARLVFRCSSDPAQPSRFVDVDADKSGAEAAVISQEADTLLALLERSTPLD